MPGGGGAPSILPVRFLCRPAPADPSPSLFFSPPAAGPSATLTHSPPAEAQGAHVPQQDEASSPALLTKMQESLLGYWDTAKAAAHKLYKKTYLPTVDEKIRYHLPPTHTPGARSPRPQPLFPQPQKSRPPATHPSDTGSRPPAPPPSVRLSFLPRDIYSKSTAAVTTYAGIITDQVFSILSGED